MNVRIEPRFTPMKLIVSVLMGVLIGSTFIVSQEDAHAHHGHPYVIVENSEVAPVLGVLVDRNLQVLSIDGHGSAARAGIQPGDHLDMIGGVPLPANVSIPAPDAHSSAPFLASVPPTSSAFVKEVLHRFVPNWEHSVAITLHRSGRAMTLQVLVTAQAYNYDTAAPPPPSTPVPESLWSSTFYL